MTDLGISLEAVRTHYERRGLEFQPFDLLDVPAITAVRDSLRIVLQGEQGLTYAGISCPTDNIPEDEMAELAELIIPEWDPVGGFVPTDTHTLRSEQHGVSISFVRVDKIKRCLFSIEPC